MLAAGEERSSSSFSSSRNVNVITTGVFDIIFLDGFRDPRDHFQVAARPGGGAAGGGVPGWRGQAGRGVMTLGGPISFNKTKERRHGQAAALHCTLHSDRHQQRLLETRTRAFYGGGTTVSHTFMYLVSCMFT